MGRGGTDRGDISHLLMPQKGYHVLQIQKEAASSLIALSLCQNGAITSKWLGNRSCCRRAQESEQVVQLVMTDSDSGNSVCAGDSQGELLLAGAGQTHSHMGPGSAVQPEL